MRTLNSIRTGVYGWGSISPEKLQEVFSDASKKILKLKKELKFDAIAFSGSSGCALGFYLAGVYGIPVMYVRKDGESSHDYQKLVCNFSGSIKKYLIIDDFIASGATVKHIYSTIRQTFNEDDSHRPKPVGVFCYDSSQQKRTSNTYGELSFWVSGKLRKVKIPIYLNYDE